MITTPGPNSSEASATNVRLPWESMDGDEDPSAGAAPFGTAPADDSIDAPVGAPVDAPVDAAAAETALAEGPVAANDSFVVDDTAAAVESDVQVALEPEPEVAPQPEAQPTYDDFDPVEYESPLPAEPLIDDLGPPPPGGGWTIVSLCAGIAIIACCVLIPQADSNRRLAWEREKLKADLDSIRKQVATNDEFLRRVADDPNLAERLAQRQMKIIREGTRVLELKKDKAQAAAAQAASGSATPGLTPDEMSPFHLVRVEPPPPMPPYQPRGGILAGLCYHPRSRLYLIGTGLFLMAIGLVLGFAPAAGGRHRS